MQILRSVGVAVAAHSALKTGVHGVASDYVAKSTNVDQLIRNADVAVDAAIAKSKLALVLVNGGTYTGDATANRAIAHGLGAIPKAVFIQSVTPFHWHRIIHNGIYMQHLAPAGLGYKQVTEWTDTNFYVGNSDDYAQSANFDTRVYLWVAVG